MTEDAIARIVVGLDGSPGAEQALSYAIRVARPGDAEIIAVAVLEPLPAVYTGLGAYSAQYPTPEDVDKVEAELRGEWCAPLAASGLRWRSMVRVGRPAEVLDRAALDEDADLIVVGRRGRGSLAELFLGSVSHELSHRAGAPVLIVSRRKDEERLEAREQVGQARG